MMRLLRVNRDEVMKYGLTLLIFLVYGISFKEMRYVMGDGVAMLSLFPCIWFGWMFPLRGAMIGCAMIFLLNLALYQFLSPDDLVSRVAQNLFLGMVTLTCVSALISWMRQARARMVRQFAERREVERALEASERRFRLMFENMVEGIAIDELHLDSSGQVVDWTILDVNPGYTRIFGIPKKKAQGSLGTALYRDEADIRQLLAIFQHVHDTGEPVTKYVESKTQDRCLSVTVTKLSDTRVSVLLSDITEKQKAMEAEQAQRRMAEALRDIAAALTSTLRLEDVLDRILLHIQHIASYDAVNIMLVDSDRVTVVRHSGYHERGLEDYINGFQQVIANVPGLRWMAENMRPLVLPDTSKSDSWLAFPQTAWIRSYAGLPIMARGELIGFLNFNSAASGFFSAGRIDSLLPFADQAALAISNARVFEETTLQARRLTLMNRISGQLNKPLEMNSVLQVTLDCFMEALNIQQASLSLVDSQKENLVVMVDRTVDPEQGLAGTIFPLDGNRAFQAVYAKKSPLLIKDPRSDPALEANHQTIERRGITSILLVPLLNNDAVIGIIAGEMLGGGRAFQPEDIDLAMSLANMAALRIEQARFFENEHRRASELAMLHAISLEITGTRHQGELFERVVRSAAWLLKAGGGSLYLVDEAAQSLICKVSCDFPYNPVGAVVPFGHGAAGTVAQTGLPLLIPHYASWQHRILSEKEIRAPFSLMTVPVVYQTRTIGVIQLLRETKDGPFTERDMDLFSLLSYQVAISLENTRLYEEIQRLAIQDALTGVYNRRGILDVAEREIERARRYGRSVAVGMLDVDLFKRVNDTYGHPVGDEVLAGIARFLQNNLRGIDLVGRYGGEEYLFVLVENDQVEAQKVAERLCKMIATAPMITSVGPLFVTVSIGLAVWQEESGSLMDLIREADEALYRAKRTGRNRVCCRSALIVESVAGAL